MLGAIYIGLSGMTAYSKGLQTISNNVANLNTSGFKSTSVNFTDLYNYGGSGLSYMGGTSTGSGIRFADPRVNFTQGDLRESDNDLDLAIEGNGFLVLLDGDKTYYARTGQFVVDEKGYITQQGTDYRLGVLGQDGRVTALNIDAKRTSAPQKTTKVVFADNLSSGATQATVSDIAVYDGNGGKQVWTVTFDKAASSSSATTDWAVTVKDATGTQIGTSTLKFIGSTVDPSTATLDISTTSSGSPLTVTLDFSSNVTAFSSGTSSTLRAASVDGHGAGSLTGVTVDADGKVKLGYSNEQSNLLGAVAIADFRDPQQLERVGNGLYRNAGAGEMRLLASGSEGAGTIKGKRIEASNVDLSKEFGDLILIQRGFQASSQVVSVSNDMIQLLFGIRGQ
jgi:flagellar hook protein FlgE